MTMRTGFLAVGLSVLAACGAGTSQAQDAAAEGGAQAESAEDLSGYFDRYGELPEYSRADFGCGVPIEPVAQQVLRVWRPGGADDASAEPAVSIVAGAGIDGPAWTMVSPSDDRPAPGNGYAQIDAGIAQEESYPQAAALLLDVDDLDLGPGVYELRIVFRGEDVRVAEFGMAQALTVEFALGADGDIALGGGNVLNDLSDASSAEQWGRAALPFSIYRSQQGPFPLRLGVYARPGPRLFVDHIALIDYGYPSDAPETNADNIIC